MLKKARKILIAVVCMILTAGMTCTSVFAADQKSAAATHKYAAADVVRLAKAQFGKGYKKGTYGTKTFDCIGLVKYVFKQYGIDIAFTTDSFNEKNYAKYGVKIDRKDLKPGDVVCFGSSSSKIGHVGIYVGDGIMINAMNPKMGVKYCFIDKQAYNASSAKNTKSGKSVTIDGKKYTLGYFTTKYQYAVRIYGADFTSVKLSSSEYNFTGSECRPSVTVKFASVTLKEGTDYTLSYQNNVNPGTASVTVTGKGKYKGVSAAVSFTIQGSKTSSAAEAAAQAAEEAAAQAAAEAAARAEAEAAAQAAAEAAARAEAEAAAQAAAEAAARAEAEAAAQAAAEAAAQTAAEAAAAVEESAGTEAEDGFCIGETIVDTANTVEETVETVIEENPVQEVLPELTNAFLPEGTLAEGRAFTISGVITSETSLTQVTVVVKDTAGNELFSETANPDSNTFSLYSLDGGMSFKKLPAGSYLWSITAVNGMTFGYWEGSFNVAKADAKGQNVTYPQGTIQKGHAFTCKGKVTAGTSLTNVTMSVRSTDGTVQFEASAAPNATSFDLYSLDGQMTYRRLPAGKYIYRVSATDSSGVTSYLITQSFTVQ